MITVDVKFSNDYIEELFIPEKYRRCTLEHTVQAYMFDNGFMVDLALGKYDTQWLHDHILASSNYER